MNPSQRVHTRGAPLVSPSRGKRSGHTVSSIDTATADLTAEELLCRTGGGDLAAFTELFDRVSPRVYGMALRVLRDPAQAEEVSQEVMLQVWQLAGSFVQDRGSAIGWVMMLAHRRAVDRARSCQAQRQRDHTDSQLAVRSTPDDVHSVVHASLEADRVREALRTLSAPQRQAIEMAYLDGHTYVEVSRLLQIPAGTAKTRIRNGLIQLRAALVPAVAGTI